MPGIEVTRFVNLSKTEEDELSCGICYCILIEPLVTQCCRQTYCKQCISEWLNNNNTCPYDRQSLEYEHLFKAPRLVINMLNKLNIRCDYIKNGCKDIILLEMLDQHIKCCRYNPDGICIDCGFINGVVEQHKCLDNLKTYVFCEKKKNEESYAKMSSLEKNVCELKIIQNELENEVQSLTKENHRLNESKNDLKANNTRMKSILLTNEEIIIKYKESDNYLNMKLELNKRVYEEMKKQIMNKNIKISELFSSINELNAKLVEMKNTIESYETIISSNESLINEYKERNAFMMEKIKNTAENVILEENLKITELENYIKDINGYENLNTIKTKQKLLEKNIMSCLGTSDKKHKRLLIENRILEIKIRLRDSMSTNDDSFTNKLKEELDRYNLQLLDCI